ncbi:MAG: YggS family pyridoxal phosphate-dependent enzyme [Candidatus Micrarchaeota archaeon]
MNTQEEKFESIRSRVASSLPPGLKPPLLIGVTKNHSPEQIFQFYNLGMRDFGENKVQEALPKLEALPKDINWHFIGHLQSNKVREVVGKFKLIHSVDSIKLMEKINSRAQELGLIQDILLEVNVSGEESKFGLKADEVKGVLDGAGELSAIKVLGLMTMAPYDSSESEQSRIFSSLRKLAHSLSLSELSMGMSDDFEIAVKEGATMVRIGTALFGPRG